MKTTATRHALSSAPLSFAAFLTVVACLWPGLDARAYDYTWRGGDGIWEDTNNWSPTTVSGPGSATSVYIGSGTVTVSSGGDAGSLTLGDGTNMATLTCNNAGVYVSNDANVAPNGHVVLTGGNNTSLFAGGVFSVAGTVTVAGEIDWHDGALIVGTLQIATQGLVVAYSTYNHLIGGTIYNDGDFLCSADSLISDGSWLQNQPDGLLDFEGDTEFGIFGGATGPNVVINKGLMLKSMGTNTLTFDGPRAFTNSGTVEVWMGTFALYQNTDLGGTVVVSNGAALNLVSGTTVLEPGHLITGPGFYGVPYGGQITLYGDVSDANFQLTNSTIFGVNVVSGTMNAYDGGFQGMTTIAPGGTLNANGCTACGSVAASTQTSGTLTNAGTINWLSGDWICEGGTLVNASNALIRIQCDNTLSSFGGVGNWINAGTFRKTAGAGTNYIDGMTLNNLGLVDVQSGGLLFLNTFTSSGTVNVAAGAGFPMGNNTFYLNSGHSFTGAGFYGVPSALPAYIYGAIPGTNFQMNGSLYGTNTITGTMYSRQGTFSETTTVAASGVLNLSSGPTTGGVFTNAGTINWLSGSWTSQSGSKLFNEPGGLIAIRCDDPLDAFGGGGVWLNTGTIRKIAGAGTNSVFSIILTNAGLIDLQNGGLDIETTYNQTGGRINFGLAGASQYAGINFSGPAPLDGTLSVNLIGGYMPNYGDSFSVMTYPSSSGSFGGFSLPALTGLREWSVTNTGTATVLSVVKERPTLSVAQAGGGFNISWSSDADAGHNLFYSTNLTPPVVWLTVTNQVQLIGGQNVVDISPTAAEMFFELQ